MNTSLNFGKSSAPKGVFLFFVVGLFLLQIVFAFTIHGDIGPQSPIPPELGQTTPPVLIGKIDSILASQAVYKPVRPAPEAVLAPASRKIIDPVATPLSLSRAGQKKSPIREMGGRYLEYTIQAGDNLEAISKKLYGNSKMVTALVRLNRLNNEKGLRCGWNLRVPRQGLLAKSN